MTAIRPLSDADSAAFMARFREGARDFPDGFLPSSDEVARYTWDQVKPHFQMIFGAFDGSDLIGFCGYNRLDFERQRHRAEIGPFFVAPVHHGTGIASAIMDAIVAHARHAKVARLELYVESQNARALAFYQKHGFTIQATVKDAVRIGGISQDDHFCTFYL